MNAGGGRGAPPRAGDQSARMPCALITGAQRCASATAVQLNAAGQVELELEAPWRDGTTQLVMSPLEFMQWLAESAPANVSRSRGPRERLLRGGELR